MMKRKVELIDFDDNEKSIGYLDDNNQLDAFIKNSNDDIFRNKNSFVSEILESGDEMLEEIDKKKEISKIEKEEIIKKILKKSNKYSYNQLIKYELNDCKNILNEIKLNNSFFYKIYKFFR
jgi:hypothetical protein